MQTLADIKFLIIDQVDLDLEYALDFGIQKFIFSKLMQSFGTELNLWKKKFMIFFFSEEQNEWSVVKNNLEHLTLSISCVFIRHLWKPLIFLGLWLIWLWL